MTTRHVYLDTEFIPADSSLKGLISIGLCDQDGNEYYAVHRSCAWQSVVWNDWLRANVIPALPMRFPAGRDDNPGVWLWDEQHPSYGALKSPEQIAQDVADFFADTAADETRLWAWYGAQDMCRLHSLWGNDWDVMPAQIPQWFSELEQLRYDRGEPELPGQQAGLHNALADARHNRTIHEFLAAR